MSYPRGGGGGREAIAPSLFMLPEPFKFRKLRAARPFFKLTFIDTVKKAFLQVHDFSTNRSFPIFCLLAKQKPNDIFDCSLEECQSVLAPIEITQTIPWACLFFHKAGFSWNKICHPLFSLVNRRRKRRDLLSQSCLLPSFFHRATMKN